jgi:hypothetical protein
MLLVSAAPLAVPVCRGAAALGFTIPICTLLILISSYNPQNAQTLGAILMFTWYGLWFAVQARTKPDYGIALTLFYYDQRIRKEGFDSERMMRYAGMAFDLKTLGEHIETLPEPPRLAYLESRDPQFRGVPQT